MAEKRKLVTTIEFDISQPLRALREVRREMHLAAGWDWRNSLVTASVAIFTTLLMVHLFGPGLW